MRGAVARKAEKPRCILLQKSQFPNNLFFAIYFAKSIDKSLVNEVFYICIKKLCVNAPVSVPQSEQ